ncbi:hypothetical protein SS50377_27677 [Spironucleus salmonicida]|uniref:Uncharacterized protein n=1 Tax=Spironucleus salmonicida TaxID=348837 RepID=V6LPE2_9EUKA|nr:hypothetical protein SS50377_27677 [Spironucleus salmonicida]|eukprot:EST46547.1 Hypothetical protein SS50377_13351 [Spironucleus salmonicida]
MIYGQGILTILLSSQTHSYILQFQINNEIILISHFHLKYLPINIIAIDDSFYIISPSLIQKLQYGVISTSFDQFGKEKSIHAVDFDNRIAIALDSSNIVIFDPLSQTIDKKIKCPQITQLYSENNVLLALTITQNQLSLLLTNQALEQRSYQFALSQTDQIIEISKIQSYENEIIVIFSVENGPTFSAVLTTQNGQLLEIKGTGQKLAHVTIHEVVRIQETRDILYGVMKNSQIDQLIPELYDCSELYTQEKVKGKISIIGEIKCEFIGYTTITNQSLYHQQFLMCKSLQNKDLPISELFQYAVQLFTTSKIIKEERVLFEKEIGIQNMLSQFYQSSHEKLAEIVIFACLRYQELLPLLAYFVERQEQRLDILNNAPVFSMTNVRPLASFLQYLVDEACKLLEQTFSLFKQLSTSSLEYETQFFINIDQLDALQPIVQSCVQIMQLLVSTRSQFNIFSDVIKQAYYTIMAGMAFISISKIIKIFGQKKKQPSLLQVYVPLTNEGAQRIGKKEMNSNEHDISQNTFIDDETSTFHITKKDNFLYSKDFGYYTVDENLTITEQDTYSINNYEALYQKLSMDGNTAIFPIINFICQNFGTGEYIRLTINDILDMIMPTKLSKNIASSIHAQLYDSALYSLILIFGYILFQNNNSQTEIYQFLYEISPFLQNTKKQTQQLYLLSKIFSQIDAGQKEIEIDALQGNIIHLQDFEGLYSELLLMGAGRSDNQEIRAYLLSAMRNLPPPFVLDDTTDLLSQKEETGQLWAARLTQLAISRCKINLAKSLAFFSPSRIPKYFAKINLWPVHECVTGTELYLRACLMSFVINSNVADLVILITQIRVFLNSYASNQTDCQSNRRIAVLYSQIATNSFNWSEYFNVQQSLQTSALEPQDIDMLASSGYQVRFKAQPAAKMPSALILYQQITELEKKIITAFSLSNQVNQKFILVFLYQNDVQLCLQYIQQIETSMQQLDQEFVKLLVQIKQQLSIVPSFLQMQGVRKTTILASDELFIQPGILLPDAFKDDLDNSLFQLQQSLAQSMNLYITSLQDQQKKIESPELKPILIDQQQGATNFLEIISQNKPVYNIKYNQNQGYNQPQQQQYNIQNQYDKVRINTLVQNQQLYNYQIQPIIHNQAQFTQPTYLQQQQQQQPPVIRKTKAQEMRDNEIKKKLEQEKLKNQVKIGVPRQGVIGQKPISVGRGQFIQNQPIQNQQFNHIQQQYNNIQNQQYQTYQSYDQQTKNQMNFAAPYQTQQQQYNQIPYQKAPISYQAPSSKSFNPSFEPSHQQIQNNLQYNQPQTSIQSISQNPFKTTYIPLQGPKKQIQIQQFNEEQLTTTAQFVPQTTRPSILKNQMAFNNNIQSPITKKKGVAFDITM